MLAGPSSVCSQCHDAGSEPGKAAAEMAALIDSLEASIHRSDEVLSRAREYGMEVSEALLRQVEANENLVKARVAVHAFRVDAVRKPVNDGLAVTSETRKAGEQALVERDHRRRGLAVSLIAIGITIAGLWLAIRRIDAGQSA
jgi:hypothetical protein